MQNDESASDFYEAAANAISKKDSLAQSSQSLNQGAHFPCINLSESGSFHKTPGSATLKKHSPVQSCQSLRTGEITCSLNLSERRFFQGAAEKVNHPSLTFWIVGLERASKIFSLLHPQTSGVPKL
jgi:hypothetical protein